MQPSPTLPYLTRPYPTTYPTIKIFVSVHIKRSGWHAMGEPPDYIGDGSDDEVLKPFAINEDVLIELIKNTEQPELCPLFIVMVWYGVVAL